MQMNLSDGLVNQVDRVAYNLAHTHLELELASWVIL